MKILVAYASTDGQTRKICRVAADWLADAGHMAELLPIADADDIDLTRFDAVLLAASIHGGRYQKALTEFCAKHAGTLSALPSLFLSVSLVAAGHEAEDWQALEKILTDFTSATGWTPNRVEQVAGAYKPSEYDIFRRFVMRRILALKDPSADLSADIEYTDWVALNAVLSDWTTASWAEARAMLDMPGGMLNIAHEAVDRHVKHGHGNETAMLWLGKGGDRQELSYAELARQSSRFANLLAAQGLIPGDNVFALLGRIPELYIAAIGTLKAGMVFTPLFSAFGPAPIRTRMEIGAARVLVTTPELYKRKIAAWRDKIGTLKLILVTGEDAAEGCVALGPAMEAASPDFDTVPTRPEDPALIHFTSGTTGRPKGAVHVHEAVLYHAFSGRHALDLTPGTTYWCTADPGWVTGTSYGIIAPLVQRVKMIVDEAEFDLDRWYATIEREKVEVWYSAPTAIRMMMRAGADVAKPYDFSSLRFLASVGEPLNPEAVIWSEKVFGQPFHDNWWQTETGGIMIANLPGMTVKPGSMGKPMPGIRAGIVEHGNGRLKELGTGEVGELALRPGWPSMMRAYLNEQARYDKCFVDGWYLSGDLARRDKDGYFWFVGRADDLIKTSGHLVGPFEVESVLIEHPAVAEAGVIGLPDKTAGEVVKAYVTLNPGFTANEVLERDLRGHARKRLGPAVSPRAVVFRENLPKTRSGKIMRRLLKARELGLPEGDISTLETDEK